MKLCVGSGWPAGPADSTACYAYIEKASFVSGGRGDPAWRSCLGPENLRVGGSHRTAIEVTPAILWIPAP